MNSRQASWVILAAVAIAPAAYGQAYLRAWLKPQLGEQKPWASHQAEALFNEDVQDQDADLSGIRHELDFSVPVLQRPDRDAAVIGRVGGWDLATDAVLPEAGEDLPEALYDIQLGGQYRTRLANDWIGGVLLSVGSASDKPFDTFDEYAINAIAVLRSPEDRPEGWIFSVALSNQTSFLPYVPLPGAAWYVQREKVTAVLGLPASSLHWEPAEDWAVDLSYMLFQTAFAELSWRPEERLVLFGQFRWDNDAYFRAGRDDDDDRLFYYEKRAAAGLRYYPTGQIVLEVSGGWAFDRFFFEGEDYGDHDDNRIDIDDGPFAAASVRVVF
ncbi:MAG: hypothetical protein GX591_08830 [Planctomycetes bacterium]|nr:hypothetical protein [Planctomycetota bacterium]